MVRTFTAVSRLDQDVEATLAVQTFNNLPTAAASAAMLVFAGAPAAAAQPEEATTPTTTGVTSAAQSLEGEDTIVITGDRLAQQLSIRTKRDAFVVVDALSADDIGRLPDHNTAAALRRIPGISVQEDQGEPRFPVIRGLSSTYNRTSINGAIVASVDNNDRTVPLDIVPSTLAARLEVFKTITPEMDPNAIGGTINIVTRSAFDEEGFFFNGTSQVGQYEQAGEIRGERLPFRVNFSSGTIFGPDDQFGIVLAASYQVRDSDIPQVETANPSYREYTAEGAPVNIGAPTGNGILVPVQRRLFLYNNIRERFGGALTLEWQPQDSLYVRAFATYNRMEDDEERLENRYEQVGPVTNQTPTTGTFERARNIVGLGRFQINRTIWSGTLHARWEANENVRWTGDFIYSGAELDNPESTEDFRTPTGFGFNYVFDPRDTIFFQFDPLDPGALADPANYPFSQRTELARGSEEEVYEVRSDLELRTDRFGEDAAVKFGGVYRTTDREVDIDFSSISLPPDATLNYTLANAFDRTPFDVVGGYRFDLRVDSDAANQFFEANRAAFDINESNVTSDYAVTEDVYGGFLQASARHGNFTLLGGVRYERTDVDTEATRTVNGVDTPANRSGSYENWLPSVHLTWRPRERWALRAAWTNTIGRPNFASITARETISFADSGAFPTLSRGNPDLQPRESEGWDVSVEYYPRDGLIHLAWFRKEIKNEIFTLTTFEELDLGVGRGAETVQVNQPQNAESAELTGFEFGVQQAFTFLPEPWSGFGLNANLTYIDSTINFLTPAGVRNPGLFLQPEWTGNATLYYQLDGFEARVSYNYVDEFLENVNGNIPEADQYWAGRGVFDAQVSYRFNDQFELFAEVENFTDEGRRELTGPDRNLLQEAAEYGRTFWLGASVRFGG